jgi:hypothetical protein
VRLNCLDESICPLQTALAPMVNEWLMSRILR